MSTGLNLLSKILIENRVQEFLLLTDRGFYQEEVKAVKHLREHYKKYGVLPKFGTVKKQLKLDDIENEPFNYFFDEYINRLTYNEVGEIIPKIQRDVLSKNPSKAVDTMREFIKSIDSNFIERRQDVMQMADLGDSVVDYIRESRTKHGLTGITTGWPKLDAITNGFQSGDLYVVLARPKLGKSLIMARMADHAHKSGYIPMLVSMEMKALQMARRFFAMRAGVNMNYLKTGAVSTFVERAIQAEADEMRTQHPFYYVEGQFKKTTQQLQALAYGLRPNILFIDGGYLLQIAGHGARLQKWERVTEIAEHLKEIASLMMIPVVVSFQFNRQVKKGDMTAGYEMIQLSDAISQLASAGIGLFNDEDDTFNSGVRKRIELIGEGGREGEHGGFWINWLWTEMNFTEIVEDTLTDSTA